MSRRLAREYAMKIVFQIAFNDNQYNEAASRETMEEASKQLDEKNYKYLINTINQVTYSLGDIDDYIERFSENWKLERLSRVDLGIMRVAICEMLYFPDIPVRVSINEAIELAKKYSTEDSTRYINGILDQLGKRLNEEVR